MDCNHGDTTGIFPAEENIPHIWGKLSTLLHAFSELVPEVSMFGRQPGRLLYSVLRPDKALDFGDLLFKVNLLSGLEIQFKDFTNPGVVCDGLT